jgi:hypothetical protein
VHLPGGFVHKADPQLAPLLAAEFDVLDQLPIAATVAHHPDAAALDAAGLTHPSTIILFYGRDSAGPVARVGLGNAVAGGSGRYAHVPQSDTLMTVPADIEKPLGALLQIAATS